MITLIIEDVAAAAEKITRLATTHFPEATLAGPIESIEESVEWLEQNPMPDLIFMDIQLADGPSFDIFTEVKISCPVIFTTAYDEHALTAFGHNGIEYLLKPIKEEAFQQAIEKYRSWNQQASSPEPDWTKLLDGIQSGNNRKSYQKRLVIRYGQQIKALEIKDAAFFYIESKVTILNTFEGKEYPVDQNLEELQQILNPSIFFRINRKMIVNIEAIDRMSAHSKSRVRLTLQPGFPGEVIVSSERSPVFKEWLKGIPE